MRVLIAANRGASSQKVIEFGVRLASTTGGSVHILHVISNEEREAREQFPGQSRYVDVMMDEARRDFVGKLAGLNLAEAADAVSIRVGDPVAEIEKAVGELEHDILVVGMRRRSRVGKFLLGSKLQELLMASEQPVVAVPTDALV